MTDHVAAIQRRNRNEIENAEHDIDEHQFVEQASTTAQETNWYRVRYKPCESPKTISRPTGRHQLHEGQNEYGADRDHKIADRSDDRSENVVEHGILEVSRINRSGFGPADHREREVNMATAGNSSVPTGSMCLMGLSVIRPSMRAVGSPRRLAIQACADS